MKSRALGHICGCCNYPAVSTVKKSNTSVWVCPKHLAEMIEQGWKEEP